ncbi:MAG TPA: PDZ domain-containing protein [Acetobacteraceae bacterium]|nr:PDZ domain-containing protein [Acetobacteraceae bacterium]
MAAELSVVDERPPPLHVLLEVARLAALRSAVVLDKDDSPELDGIAAAAAACMGRPMGAVCFVDDDRIWFGGVHGMDWRASPRRGSFCDYAISQNVPLVVPDAAADPRFRDHQDVAGERGLRFYAGCSLEDNGGYRLGTVCVFDREPGEADPAALAELVRLAAMASAWLAAGHLQGAPAAPPERVQGWLGVRTRGSSRFLAKKPGLIVLAVAARSPAEDAGIRPTDVILAIDGQELWHASELVRALANRPADGLARLTILRAGSRLERVVPTIVRPAGPIEEQGGQAGIS